MPRSFGIVEAGVRDLQSFDRCLHRRRSLLPQSGLADGWLARRRRDLGAPECPPLVKAGLPRCRQRNASSISVFSSAIGMNLRLRQYVSMAHRRYCRTVHCRGRLENSINPVSATPGSRDVDPEVRVHRLLQLEDDADHANVVDRIVALLPVVGKVSATSAETYGVGAGADHRIGGDGRSLAVRDLITAVPLPVVISAAGSPDAFAATCF